MHINAALKTIGDKWPLLKAATVRAATDQDALIELIDMMLHQYNQTEGNKERMNRMFGEDVMKCLVDKANEINAWAEIKLAELQALEGNFNMN